MANLTSKLTILLQDDVSQPARSIAKALADTGKQVKTVADAMKAAGTSTKFQDNLAKLKLGATDIKAVSKAWDAYRASAKLSADATSWTKGDIANTKRWEAQTIRSLKEVQRERTKYAQAEKKAIEKARSSAGASQPGGHGAGIGSLLGGHALGALSAGYAVHQAYEAGAHLAHERVRQRTAGMSTGEIMDAAAESARIAAMFPSIKLTDVNHMLRNARSIVGSYAEAAEIVEPMAKLRVIAQGARPGADVSEDFDKLVKGLEIKGVTQNPKAFHEYMEGIAKGLNVFGDTLKPYQYYEMFKYGRQATPQLSSNFMLGTAPTLAQELGGSSYGNAVSGFNRAIVAGRMEHSSLKEMYRLGLVHKDDLDFLKSGEIKGLKPGHAIQGANLAQTDPNEWVKQYFLKALSKMGMTGADDVMKEVGIVFSNRMAAQMVGILATQQSRINKDLALLHHAPGLSAADEYLRHDPTIAMASLKNSIEGLTASLTSGTLTSLAPVISDVASAISGYTARLAEMQKHDATHPNEATAGQKMTNRIYNKLVNGVDSDKAQSQFTLTERNDMDYQRQRATLLGRGAETDPAAVEKWRRYHAGPHPYHDPNSFEGRVLADGEEAETHPMRLGARVRLAELDAARVARMKAQRDIFDFQSNLPRDMSMRRAGGGDSIAGSEAFGPATLGKGGMRGASFGYGGYDPVTGMPPAAQKSPFGDLSGAKIDVDTTALDATAGKLSGIIGQINVLRGGVEVPITFKTQGSIPSLGASQRGNFTTGGIAGGSG